MGGVRQQRLRIVRNNAVRDGAGGIRTVFHMDRQQDSRECFFDCQGRCARGALEFRRQLHRDDEHPIDDTSRAGHTGNI